jgi:hypothetical protein
MRAILRCLNKFVVLVCVIAGADVASNAASQIDQSNIGPSQFLADGTISFAQTFTVGTSGQLTGVDLRLLRVASGIDTGNFVVEVRSAPGGIPSPPLSPPLASIAASDTTLPNQSVGDFNYTGFTHFDLTSSGLMVNAGEVLAIDITPTTGVDNNNFPIVFGTGDTYEGGFAYEGFTATDSWTRTGVFANYDLLFNTYIDPAVPEPLFVYASVPLLLVMRRRRNAES